MRDEVVDGLGRRYRCVQLGTGKSASRNQDHAVVQQRRVLILPPGVQTARGGEGRGRRVVQLGTR